MPTTTTLFCSFCRKSDEQVAKLISGVGVYICDECVAACNRILEEHADRPVVDLARMPDEDLLRSLRETHGDLAPTALELTVRELRRRGVTWSRIGAALGSSRQAAWERFSGEE